MRVGPHPGGALALCRHPDNRTAQLPTLSGTPGHGGTSHPSRTVYAMMSRSGGASGAFAHVVFVRKADKCSMTLKAIAKKSSQGWMRGICMEAHWPFEERLLSDD